MVYSVTGIDFNKKAFINGYYGVYGKSAPDNTGTFDNSASIRYGRNAINNFNEYNKTEFGKRGVYDNPPAMSYEIKYLPEKNATAKNLNKAALMGASYEDAGSRVFIPVRELNRRFSKVLGSNACVDAYDINRDKKIDIAENAVATLIKDMVDGQAPDNPELNQNNIDGTFTNSGDINSSFMLSKKNVEKNRSLAKQIYDRFNLGEAQNRFINNR